MTKEELLKPRVIVENLYPECPFSAGQILYLDNKRIGGPMYVDDIDSRDPDYILKREADNYPYLFRELAWWEERDENDIPDYTRRQFGSYTDIQKIDKPDYLYQFVYWRKEWKLTPSDIEEYTAYQLSQKVK